MPIEGLTEKFESSLGETIPETEQQKEQFSVSETFVVDCENFEIIKREFEERSNSEFESVFDEYGEADDIRNHFRNKLQGIHEDAKKLVNAALIRLSRLVVGVSMLAATAQVTEASSTKLDSQYIPKKSEQGMLAGIENVPINDDPYVNASLIRDAFIEHIKSKAYFEKLKKECFGIEIIAKKEQLKRIENLKTVKITLKEKQEDVMAEYNRGGDKLKEGEEIDGFYDPNTHEVFAEEEGFMTLFHELSHASTRSNEDISLAALNMKSKHYKPMDGGVDEYFGGLSEWLVRKQQVDLEMEVTGIKKYSESFTKEKYELLMKKYESGELSETAVDFIKRTKPGFDNFKDIFDNIAQNENVQEANV